jgi:hypothetical protein
MDLDTDSNPNSDDDAHSLANSEDTEDYSFRSASIARRSIANCVSLRVREQNRPGNRSRKSSWIWHVGDEITEDGVVKWRCGLCQGDMVKRYTLSSTCHIKKHLEESHGFENDNRLRLAAIGPGQPTIDRYLLNARPDPVVFKRQLVDFFLVCRIPFHVIESPYFHALFESNSTLANAVPKCSDTVRNWALGRSDSAKEEVKVKLARARSLIHLAIDCWTSSNNLPIIGIVGHFADELGHFQKVLLALRELQGPILIRISLICRPPYRRQDG